MTELRVAQLTSNVGAEIGGIRLTEASDADIERVRSELHEHGVLVFRNQQMRARTNSRSPRGSARSTAIRSRSSSGDRVTRSASSRTTRRKPPQDSQNFHVDYSFNRMIPDLAVLRVEGATALAR